MILYAMHGDRPAKIHVDRKELQAIDVARRNIELGAVVSPIKNQATGLFSEQHGPVGGFALRLSSINEDTMRHPKPVGLKASIGYLEPSGEHARSMWHEVYDASNLDLTNPDGVLVAEEYVDAFLHPEQGKEVQPWDIVVEGDKPAVVHAVREYAKNKMGELKPEATGENAYLEFVVQLTEDIHEGNDISYEHVVRFIRETNEHSSQNPEGTRRSKEY
jgi:hypothetical protein